MMMFDELLSELRKLSYAEKIRAIRFLATELDPEQGLLEMLNKHYEISLPIEAPDVAQALMEMLALEKKSQHDI